MTTPRKAEVIVGVDGSSDSRRALEWATDPNKDFGDVRAVTAYSVGPMFDGMGFAPSTYQPDIFRDAAKERSEAILKDVAPSLMQTHTVASGYAGRVLVDASAGADLLVVGCRGRGALAHAFLGSVGSFCAKHAAAPLAIIPEGVETEGALDRLVVGIDGSDNSKRALRWALDNVAPGGTVAAIGTCIRIVHAFNVEGPAETELVQETKEMIKKVVHEVATKDEVDRVVDPVVLVGDPRLELRGAAQSADALVLGARGHRGVAYLLLGSVTTALTHQPTQVTIIVPDPED